MLRKLLLISSAIIGLVMSVGCSPKPETSSMKISFPDWSTVTQNYDAKRAAAAGKSGSTSSQTSEANAALSTVTAVTRVMINVSGGDIETQVRIWDIKDTNFKAGDPIPAAPRNFEFTVKRGAARTFQALAILEEIDTANVDEDSAGAMTFLYGDKVQAVSSDVEPVEFSLTDQGTSTNTDGQVAGRFLNANGTGPTGQLNMYYAPIGRPAMIVDQKSIIAGFFDIFVPPTAQFSYRLASGETLFDQITIDAFDGNLGPHLMKVKVPAGFRERQVGGPRSPSRARDKVIGFTGPGASGKKICFNSTAQNLSDLGTVETIGDTTRVVWDPTSALATRARVAAGGVGAADGECPAGSGEFGVDHLKVQTQSLQYGDSPVGLRGPFRELASGSSMYLSASPNAGATQLTLTWKYLRPTIGAGVDGVGIFTKVYADGTTLDNRWYDSAPCKTLTNLGFTEITRVAAGTAAAPVESYVLANLPSAAYEAGRHMTVICPYSQQTGYHNVALTHYAGSENNNTLPATKIEITRISSAQATTAVDRANVADSVCTPIVVRTLNAMGEPASRAQGGDTQATITLVGAAGPSYIFTDSGCYQPASSTTFQLPIKTEKVMYVNIDSSTTNFQIDVTDSTGAGTALTPASFFATRIASATPDQLLVQAPTSIYAHQCVPVGFVRGRNVGGEFIPDGSGMASVDLTATLAAAGGDLEFSTNNQCTYTATSSAYFGSSDTFVPLYMVYKGTAASLTLNPDGSGSSLTNVSNPVVTVQQPGAPTKIEILLSLSFSAESCRRIGFEARDSSGHPSPIASGATLTLSTSIAPPTDSGFFSDSSCDISSGNTVTIASGDASESAPVYFRWTTPGSVTIAGTSTAGLPVTGLTATVGAAQVAMIIARLPSITWAFPNSYSPGLGPQVISGMGPGTEFQLILEARTPMGSLVPTFNVTDISPSGLNVTNQYQETPTCTTPIWTGGQTAPMMCTFPDTAYAAGYLVTFRTGSGSTPYDYINSDEQFFVSDAGELGSNATFVFTRPFSSYLDACQPVMVQRRTGLYLATPVQSPLVLPLTHGAGVTAFYQDPACGTGATTDATIPAGSSATVVYAKMSGSGTIGIMADSAGYVDPATLSGPATSNAGPGGESEYRISVVTTTTRGSCEPVMAVLTDASGHVTVVSGANRTLTLTESGLAAEFFSDGMCSVQVGSVPLLTGESTALFYYRANGLGSGTLGVMDGVPLSGTSPSISVSP